MNLPKITLGEGTQFTVDLSEDTSRNKNFAQFEYEDPEGFSVGRLLMFATGGDRHLVELNQNDNTLEYIGEGLDYDDPNLPKEFSLKFACVVVLVNGQRRFLRDMEVKVQLTDVDDEPLLMSHYLGADATYSSEIQPQNNEISISVSDSATDFLTLAGNDVDTPDLFFTFFLDNKTFKIENPIGDYKRGEIKLQDNVKIKAGDVHRLEVDIVSFDGRPDIKQIINIHVVESLDNEEAQIVQLDATPSGTVIAQITKDPSASGYSVYEVGEDQPSSIFSVDERGFIKVKGDLSPQQYTLKILSNGDGEDQVVTIDVNDFGSDFKAILIDSVFSDAEDQILNLHLGLDQTDGDVLSFVREQAGETAFGTWQVHSNDGETPYVVFKPKGSAAGQTDTFNLQITDNRGGFEDVTITVNIGNKMKATLDTPNLDGTLGNDVLTGNHLDNRVDGSDGDDRIFGEGGTDNLYGSKGNDYLYGGDDRDYLYGESGTDTLDGGAGADHINGGKGEDTILGGIGDDFIVVRFEEHGDTIRDFNDNEGDILCIPGYGDIPIHVIRENGNTYLKDGSGKDAEVYVTLIGFTNPFTAESLVEYDVADLVGNEIVETAPDII